MDEGHEIGRRLREIRSWRQMTLKATAELAGLSFGYLGRLERGDQPITKRSTLEALANTLRVSPTELTGKPWAPTDPVGADAHAALAAIETALEEYELGIDPGVAIRPWPELAADVERLCDLQHVHADYAAQGQLAPVLLGELHATYVRDPQHRRDALLGLVHCYSSACTTTKRLGGRGLPLLAVRMAQQCAQELDSPEWTGYTIWLRSEAAGELSRTRQYARSVAAAEDLSRALDDPNVTQTYGMLHLSAALAAAAQGDRDTATTHLDEAQTIANRMEVEVGGFARLWFGRTNVGIWRTSLLTELGEGPKVAEAARSVHPELIPSPSRQAEFYIDLGRAMLTEPATRDRGLSALLHAEKLATQRVRNDVFVREAVGDLLRRARRDAGSRELRGLAWRMGVAPAG
ncbi:helix-turn-helix domain-containing protein [Saccharopolyspora phatthalungensis]|uniref:helix-turn-helix domain-containing protein n=1 Tax=Saccharopolyspora phatthalungensis TaxID=664693 RepID=UPI0028B003FA|nr:helix-turn-helix transcriptional regulator [Saccharopolyspora phatthalungensis]